MSVIRHCGAISRQGNVCAREEGHEGCHEVYVDGDGRRWWGEMSAVELAEQLRGAVKALEVARSTMRRSMASDEFCDLPFNEDMADALKLIDAALGGQ